MSNPSKVIDKFGQYVITFRTQVAASKFLALDGVDYDPAEVESICAATDADRAEAGIQAQTTPSLTEKVLLRRMICNVSFAVQYINPAAKVPVIKL
jgi:hypothetical protein